MRKKRGVKRLDLVLVKWRDSVSFDGWVDQHAFEDSCLSEAASLGIVLKITDDAIWLAQDINDCDACSGIIIPRCNITSIDVLKKEV